MMDKASANTLKLAQDLQGQLVHISCDKGHKKKVGHFVKCASWLFSADRRLCVVLPDVDAGEGTTEECSQAIVKSLKKVNGGGPNGCFSLNGQLTDSGGGGILDKLAKSLQAKGVCVDDASALSAPATFIVHSCSSLCQPKNSLVREE